MKWLGRIVAIALFLAVMGYGLSRFLAASELRTTLADAERACGPHGGIQELEAVAGGAVRVMCADGTRPVVTFDGDERD